VGRAAFISARKAEARRLELGDPGDAFCRGRSVGRTGLLEPRTRYLHPLIAMWFLERQIRRTKPEWLRGYHICLATIPIFLLVLWVALSSQPNLSEETRLFWRIAQHAGSEILPGLSSRLLVATHVFLESIHYFVWILLIPLVDRRAIPWRLRDIPCWRMRMDPKIFVGILRFGLLA
jgi:hypothetical protein